MVIGFCFFSSLARKKNNILIALTNAIPCQIMISRGVASLKVFYVCNFVCLLRLPFFYLFVCVCEISFNFTVL